MNSTEIFSIALGLSSPWYVKDLIFSDSGNHRELHIYLDFERGHKFIQSDGSESTAYDTVEGNWQHLNFFEHKCYLHARVPRVKDSSGGISVQSVPWARKGSGFTLLFEAFSMLLIESEMPVARVGKLLKVYPQRIWTIFSYWMNIMHQQDEVGEIRNLGIDETSTKKGHNYVTLAVDMDARRVLFSTEGKGADCIEKTTDYLQSKDVETDMIENVCIDMSPSFISGCEKYLPNTAVTFDRFHVVKEVKKAMDEVRKAQSSRSFDLKGHKYTFLKNKLPLNLRIQKEILMEKYHKLADAHMLTEMFDDFWTIKEPEQAMAYLSFWCDIAEDSKLAPFIKAVNTIKNHWQGIVNYTRSNINNGILEGINSKIQLAKKRARGYKNIQNFIHMIYFIAGKLKPAYPQYFT